MKIILDLGADGSRKRKFPGLPNEQWLYEAFTRLFELEQRVKLIATIEMLHISCFYLKGKADDRKNYNISPESFLDFNQQIRLLRRILDVNYTEMEV